MKLDPTMLRYLEDEDWRVLTAIEMGMRNHELVPTALVERIAGLRYGGVKRNLTKLLQYQLIHHERKEYDGFKLNYLGYDFLALRAFVKRGTVAAVGNQIGVGKESDVYVVSDSEGRELILKLHRLGRTSFQQVTNKRDYTRRQGKRGGAGWLYLSRLSAMKEYAFMKALHSEGFNVPTPVDYSRHCVLMSVVPGYLLANITQIGHPERVYQRCLNLIAKLAQYGLIHGDLNQYNLMITDDEQVFCIDFPQMTSTSHLNAQMYFDRDLEGIHNYFKKKYNISYDYHPKLVEDPELQKKHDLDAQVGASGWSNKHQQDMDRLIKVQGGQDNDENDSEEGSNEENEENAGDKHEDNESQKEEEDEVDEEEEDLTPEEDDEEGSKRTLNNKGKGFFDQERSQDAQGVQAGPQIISRVSRNKSRKGRSFVLKKEDKGQLNEEDEENETKGISDDENDLKSLGQKDDNYIRNRVKQQITKEATKDYVRRVGRHNVHKGREKIRIRNQVKATLMFEREKN